MVYCPKCKAENADNATVCEKCGHKLGKNDANSADYKEEFLISVREGYEADMVEGSLRTAGIPFYKKGHSGLGGGITRYDTKYESAGVDFYVPHELLDKAIEVLPPVEGAEELQKALAEKESFGTADKAPEKSGNAPSYEESPAKRTLAIILFLILMAAVIFGVDSIMNYIREMLGY